jgi:glycosyltransferase involved in cell wall biosynthesis
VTNDMTTDPLHIAVDAGPLYGQRTGVAAATDGIMQALERRDDVAVAPYLVSFRSTPTAGHRRLPLPGLVASHLWSRANRPLADRWLGEVDVVHGTNYVAPPTRLPTVISVYDCWFLAHPELAAPIVRRAGAILRRAVQRGAWIHASSDATAEAARSLLGTDRVVTVHLGPPPTPPVVAELAQPSAASVLAGTQYVVSIATEERRKALPVLVQAFALHAADDHTIHLVLAGGPGDDSEAISAAVAALPESVRARVHHLGRIDDETKHWLLRHAAALAYPSLDEGFGFPILESQAAGTPVVASRVGAITEVAGDAAVLVDEHHPEAFAAGLRRALDSGVERLGLIEAGYRNVTRFSWERTAGELVDLYRTAMEHHR